MRIVVVLLSLSHPRPLPRYVDTGDMLNDFPYRARAMFAFEEQDGVDVCFFGMHVQVCAGAREGKYNFIFVSFGKSRGRSNSPLRA